METLELKANNDAFLNAIKTFDVKRFKDYMKTWQPKSYKKFKVMSYGQQKQIMCQCIVDNKSLLDKELVLKASEHLKKEKAKEREALKKMKKGLKAKL